MDASIAHERIAGEAAGHEDAEEALFAGRARTRMTMIAWAGREQSLALEHEQLESETMKAGFEFMRLLTQAHLDLRAAREQRRDDVTDADGDARTTCEDGHQRTRVMIYGPVTTSRIAYRKSAQGEPVPAGRGAELGGGSSYSAGIIRRNAEAVATAPFGPAAAQVSAAGRDPPGQTAVRGARGRHGRGLRGVLRRPPPGAVRPGDRAAADRGRVRVPGAARRAAARDREGRGGPRGRCRGLRLAG